MGSLFELGNIWRDDFVGYEVEPEQPADFLEIAESLRDAMEVSLANDGFSRSLPERYRGVGVGQLVAACHDYQQVTARDALYAAFVMRIEFWGGWGESAIEDLLSLRGYLEPPYLA